MCVCMIQPNPLQSLPTQSNTPHSNQTESYPIKPIQSNPKPHTLINHNPNNSSLSQSNHLPSPPFHSLCITIPSADLSVYRFVLWPMSTMAEPSMSLRMCVCVWWPPIPAEKQSTGLCVEWCVVTTLLTHTFLKNDRSDFVSNCVCGDHLLISNSTMCFPSWHQPTYIICIHLNTLFHSCVTIPPAFSILCMSSPTHSHHHKHMIFNSPTHQIALTPTTSGSYLAQLLSSPKKTKICFAAQERSRAAQNSKWFRHNAWSSASRLIWINIFKIWNLLFLGAPVAERAKEK